MPTSAPVPSLPEAPIAGGWSIERFALGPGAFHALEVVERPGRQVWISNPSTPAVVLGSTQPGGIVDIVAAARRGIEVVRRRSGGGAVLVVPGDLCWIDLVIERGDALWDDDVGLATHWVGEVWRAALSRLGLEVTVHHGPVVRSPWSELVCFAGLGPGEVVGDGGAKVVGISQRRTRHWARFQTAGLVRWEPFDVAQLLVPEPPAPLSDLARAAQGCGRPAARLEAAFLAALPAH